MVPMQYRSRRRESALTFIEFKVRGLTSAATRVLWSESIRVFDAATVGLGLADFHRFTGEQGVHGFADIIARGFGVVLRIGFVVNRAVIGEHAVLINHIHVRRGFHAVKMADRAGAVVNPGRGNNFLVGDFLPGLFGRAMARIVGVDGIDDEPHDALGSQVFFQLLHRAGLVMIVTEWTIGVVGFQYDNLALVIAELDCFTV